MSRAKDLRELPSSMEAHTNGIDVHGVGSNFKSESYNILNLQTDTNDDQTSTDGIFKITTGSAGTTKGEFRWDESEDLVHVSYGDHGRHISIDSGGQVGIGTGSTAPSQNLHVSSSDNTRVLVTAGTNKYAELQFENDAQKFAMGVQNDDKFFLYNSTGTSQVLTVDTSSRIGIGTQNPDRALHIEGSDFSSSTIRLKRTSGGTNNDAGLQFTSAAGANADTGMGGIWFQNSLDGNAYALIRARTDDATGTSGRLDFMTSTSLVDNNTSPSLTIKSSGNVGIGEVSPAGKLEVQNTSVNYAILGTSNKGHYFESQSDDNTDGFEIYQQHGSTASRHSFIVNDNRTGSKSAAFAVRGDGRVGIGTTNPLTKLHAQVSNVSGYTSVQNDGIVIERTGGTAALNIATDVDQTGAIWFGDATDADAGGIFYEHNADRMIFRVAAGSRVKINSQGVIEGASDAEIKTSPIRKHSNTISTNTTIDSSENAIASGPISVATGVTLTINGNMTVV